VDTSGREAYAFAAAALIVSEPATARTTGPSRFTSRRFARLGVPRTAPARTTRSVGAGCCNCWSGTGARAPSSLSSWARPVSVHLDDAWSPRSTCRRDRKPLLSQPARWMRAPARRSERGAQATPAPAFDQAPPAIRCQRLWDHSAAAVARQQPRHASRRGARGCHRISTNVQTVAARDSTERPDIGAVSSRTFGRHRRCSGDLQPEHSTFSAHPGAVTMSFGYSWLPFALQVQVKA
jgi:hypothetical protein